MDRDDESLPSPWHEGERAVQARAGSRERMEQVGRLAIRRFMPDQHRAFFAQLPFLLVGSVDGSGWPWASALFGWPGFARSPDPGRLDIAAWPVAGDPLRESLSLGAPLGLLGIELPTRRRNRMNGHVVALGERAFSVAVDQSFGNCPQYIQRRDYAGFDPEALAREPRVEPFAELDDRARSLITRADTMFVASASAADRPRERGVDVSHRGGRPGFLGFDPAGAILVPDFRGNRFFNTLGNLAAYPRAGLLFLDFEHGDLLQLTGATEILWDGPELRGFRGAERLWRFSPSHGRWLLGALPLGFAFGDLSMQSLGTGTWAEAAAAQG